MPRFVCITSSTGDDDQEENLYGIDNEGCVWWYKFEPGGGWCELPNATDESAETRTVFVHITSSVADEEENLYGIDNAGDVWFYEFPTDDTSQGRWCPLSATRSGEEEDEEDGDA